MLSQVIPTKRKSRSVSSFLKKTYQIIEDQRNFGIVKWAESGVGFVIIQEEEFSKKVLPHYFKHSNYSSFVRQVTQDLLQLNMYNFHKVREVNFESHFHHQFFIKDNKYRSCKFRQMLSEIRRKPEKKKRKYEEGSEEEQEQDIDEDKSIVSMKKRVKQKTQSLEQAGSAEIRIKSYRSPASKKIHENTRHALGSQKQNKENLEQELVSSKNWIFPKSQSLISKQRISIQNILNMNEVEEDKLSINNDLGEVIPKYATHEFFFPSNNNIYPLQVKGFNLSNFNLM